MNITEALGMSITGMLIVFAVLVSIMALIYIISAAVRYMSKNKAEPIAAANEPAQPTAPPAAAYALNNVDERTAREVVNILVRDSKTSAEELGIKSVSFVGDAVESVGEINLVKVEEETAALIMAIVANSMKVPLHELRFKSIKLIGDVD